MPHIIRADILDGQTLDIELSSGHLILFGTRPLPGGDRSAGNGGSASPANRRAERLLAGRPAHRTCADYGPALGDGILPPVVGSTHAQMAKFSTACCANKPRQQKAAAGPVLCEYPTCRKAWFAPLREPGLSCIQTGDEEKRSDAKLLLFRLSQLSHFTAACLYMKVRNERQEKASEQRISWTRPPCSVCWRAF